MEATKKWKSKYYKSSTQLFIELSSIKFFSNFWNLFDSIDFFFLSRNSGVVMKLRLIVVHKLLRCLEAQ